MKTSKKSLKVALVCDWLTEVGGAEEVLMEFHKMFPNAPIYTSIYRKGRIDWFKDTEVKTGYLNYFPVQTRRFLAPLRQKYFKSLDLSEYDLVISVTGSDAKFVQTSGTHLCFCHCPTQYYWGKREQYLKNPGFGFLNPLVRPLYKAFLPKLAEKDLAAAQNPDQFITISNFTKQEIKTFYKREAKVVSPPVNYALFSQVVDNYKTKKGKSQIKNTTYKIIKSSISQARNSEQHFCTKLAGVENLSVLAKIIAKYPDGFYLNFSRQVNWKRLDIAIEACKELNLPLVLVGNGPENHRLRKLAKNAENITFVDFLPKKDLAILASLARAFIFPSKEPFGIAPVEALAAGCPVVALKAGGALDFIKNGQNGLFFESEDANSLEQALVKLETGAISLGSPKQISLSAKPFASVNFRKKLQKELASIKKKRCEVVFSSSDLPEVTTEDECACPVTTGSGDTCPKKTNALRRALVLLLPLNLFFSFFPSINLGDTTSMHLELSLPLIWLALFSVLSLKSVLRYLKTHLKTPLLAFPLFATLSLLISSDKTRAVLTFVVLACLFVSVIGLHLYLKREKLPSNFHRAILTETVFICFFCLLQSLFDALGASPETTKICDTCRTTIFGFPHPNGFAIEPQFMGSLLLAPLFLAYNSLLENNSKKSQGTLVTIILIIETTLFFTFSRGAIFAALIGLIFLIFANKSLKKAGKILLLTLNSFIFTLILQGSLAVIGPTSTSFEKTADTVVSQLSLGRIALESPEAQSTQSNDVFTEPEISPNFDGYVAESTNRRLELAFFATKIATENPKNTLFGTGLGSAGKEMYTHFPERQGHEKEIVQNEYLEIFLELGLFGIISLALSLITFLKLEKIRLIKNPYLLAILLVFAITLLFFSGLPNALHIYLLPVLWYHILYDKDCLSGV